MYHLSKVTVRTIAAKYNENKSCQHQTYSS